MTLGELKEAIDQLLRDHPAGADLPVMIVPGYDDWRDVLSISREGARVFIDTTDRDYEAFESWCCALCGHRHAGKAMGNICIGCPCPATTPTNVGAAREERV